MTGPGAELSYVVFQTKIDVMRRFCEVQGPMEASHRNSIRNTSAARRQSFECFSPPQAKLCMLQSDVGGAL
jgi:hypothetical protein